MRKLYVVGVLGILVLSIGLYLSKPANRDVRVHEIAELRAEVERLRADLTRSMDELHPDVGQLRVDLTAEKTQRERAFAELEARVRLSERAAGGPGETMRVGATAANKRTRPVEESAEAPAPADAGEQAVKNQTEFTEFMETSFAKQNVDPSWAPAAEEMIRYEVGDQLPPDSVIQSVECRKSICRIETVHYDSDAYQQFLTDTFKDPNKRVWSGDASSQELAHGPHGESVVVTYFSREDESLPTISR